MTGFVINIYVEIVERERERAKKFTNKFKIELS